MPINGGNNNSDVDVRVCWGWGWRRKNQRNVLQRYNTRGGGGALETILPSAS